MSIDYKFSDQKVEFVFSENFKSGEPDKLCELKLKIANFGAGIIGVYTGKFELELRVVSSGLNEDEFFSDTSKHPCPFSWTFKNFQELIKFLNKCNFRIRNAKEKFLILYEFDQKYVNQLYLEDKMQLDPTKSSIPYLIKNKKIAIMKAIMDIKIAISIDNNKYVKFSRIKQASNYLEKGLIKFEGYSQGEESLRILKFEFPRLHDVIKLIHEHSELKEGAGIWREFKEFLLALRNIIDSKYILLPTKDMIEKDPKFEILSKTWYEFQKYMEKCCEFIVSSSVDNINLPNLSFLDNIEVKSQLSKLVDDTELKAKALQESLNK